MCELEKCNIMPDTRIQFYYDPDGKSELLRNCLALKKHRRDIASFFESFSDKQKRADYVKSFFDNTYVEHILNSGDRVGYRAFDEFLIIWHGSYPSRDKECFLKWTTVADAIYGQILLEHWLSPDEKDSVTQYGQFSLFDVHEDNVVAGLPQKAIDYVLTTGSDFCGGKKRIYDQFKKCESLDKNIAFLKKEYGIGGRSDAIPQSGYLLNYNAKGIELRKCDDSTLLSWLDVSKAIKRLIDEEKYL